MELGRNTNWENGVVLLSSTCRPNTCVSQRCTLWDINGVSRLANDKEGNGKPSPRMHRCTIVCDKYTLNSFYHHVHSMQLGIVQVFMLTVNNKKYFW